MLEPTRSNLVTSSNFQSGWSLLSGGSITQNQSISPDGTQNAAILSGNGVGPNAAYTFINITAQEYTYSMFAKKGSEYILRMKGFSGGANGNVEFNLNNGTIETPSDGTFSNEKIEDYGNGWYRCIVKVTATSSGSKTFGFNREAIVSGNLFSVYGAQLEQGSYATSYIPTQGGVVTRNQDSCEQTVPSEVFNSYPFSVFAEIDVVDTSNGYAFSLLNKSSSNQYFTIEYYSNKWHIVARPSGSTITMSSSEVLTKGTHKLVGVYTDTNLKLFLNGSLIASGSNTQSFNSNINSLLLGQLRISADIGSRNSIRQTELYNTALTDQEAIALTTI